MLHMNEKPKKARRAFQSTRRANGPAVRYYRERRGWTLQELQNESGVSYTQISRIETGESRSPRKGTLKALAAALGVDMDALVFYDAPTGVPDKPGPTQENLDKREVKKREKEERDAAERARRERDAHDTGDRTL